MNAPTLDELRAAWQAMRHRPCLRHWPADFEAVMQDAFRSRLVAIEATAARHRCAARPAPRPAVQPPVQRAPRFPTAPDLFDRKRLAAGDRD